MAVSKILTGNAMALSYKTGVDPKGKDIIKSQNFKGINTTATNDEIMTLSEKLQTVIAYPINEVELVETSILVKESI